MRTEKPKGLYLLGESAFARIYGADTRRDIEAQVEIVAPLQTPESIAADPSVLADVSFIFSGWGMAHVDEAFLDAAPNLKAIFYAAGTVRYFVTDAMWERGVRLTSGYGANAEFVAPYTLAQIILSLKRVWHFANKLRQEGTFDPLGKEPLPRPLHRRRRPDLTGPGRTPRCPPAAGDALCARPGLRPVPDTGDRRGAERGAGRSG